MKVSEWADRYRKLSSESASMPGQWVTARAEYQREIMDAFNEPLIEEVVVMSSAQVGKSEILNNVVGYFVHQDPCPILLIQPTLEVAEDYSKDRIAPMIRDSEVLSELIGDIKSKSSDNTILHKKFPGGYLAMAGANSPSGLASKPIRIVLMDEVDRYPASAGAEGDPTELAKKRTTAFPNKKMGFFSTPGNKISSKIEPLYENSDKRKFFVPCHECGFEQVLLWKQVKFPDKKPELAYYECERCSCHWSDAHRRKAVKNGKWVKTKPEEKKTAGFWLNELYGPFVKLEDMVRNFLKAQSDPLKMKTFVNTSLGETWEEKGDGVEGSKLYRRRESYGPAVPANALVLTAGVDVQGDRLECEVVAWGPDEESWSMDYRIFFGDPAQDGVWQDLDNYLVREWVHELGPKLTVKRVFIDSGGHHTQKVYEFTKKRNSRGVYASKGSSIDSKPIVGMPSKVGEGKYKLFLLGVSAAKEVIYSRLDIERMGPGYCHFRVGPNTKSYFKQLTSETLVTRNKNGVIKQVWTLPPHKRNEVLDCRIMALAAIKLLRPEWEPLKNNFEKLVKSMKSKPTTSVDPVSPNKTEDVKEKVIKRKTGNFATEWKNW